MSNDYQKGFKDGFVAGLEEGKKLVTKQTRLDDYIFGQPGYLGTSNTCQVCGRLQSGIQGYVCYSPRCPSMSTTHSTSQTSAVDPGEFSDKKAYDQRGWRIK